MVSLNPDRFNMSTSAQYMDEVLSESSSVTNTLGNDVEPILSTGGHNFKKLNTITAYSIHLLVSIIISFVGILFVVVWPQQNQDKAYFVMIALRVAYWLITFLFDHLIRKQHNDLRMNGYHDFHRSMVRQNGVSLNVASAWNTILLLLQALLQQYCENRQLGATWFTPIVCIVMFQVFETLVLIATHSLYIAKVYKFNKSFNCPDALVGSDNVAGSLGIMQPDIGVAELLEKQADLIAYLKDHNQKLKQKLHHMQLNARGGH